MNNEQDKNQDNNQETNINNIQPENIQPEETTQENINPAENKPKVIAFIKNVQIQHPDNPEYKILLANLLNESIMLANSRGLKPDVTINDTPEVIIKALQNYALVILNMQKFIEIILADDIGEASLMLKGFYESNNKVIADASLYPILQHSGLISFGMLAMIRGCMHYFSFDNTKDLQKEAISLLEGKIYKGQTP